IFADNSHDRLAVKLDSFRGEVPMTQAHHNAVFRLGADFEDCRYLSDHQRMISRCRKPLRYARVQSFAVMENFADFTVHQGWSADDLSSKHLTNRLMPKANSQDRCGFVKVADDAFSDPGIGRCSRPWRNHDALRSQTLY